MPIPLDNLHLYTEYGKSGENTGDPVEPMKTFQPNLVTLYRVRRDLINPFVYKKIPSVYSVYSQIIPLVCKKIPFVRVNRFYSNSIGFTLVELVVTIAVAAILVTVAVPNFRVFVQNSRISTQANDLISDISLARSEAIKSGANASLCTSTAGASCNGSGNWTTGRLAWTDTNNNNALDAGEIRRFREQMTGGNGLFISVATDPLTFTNRGAPSGGGALTFSVCDSRGNASGRDVTINPLGQARVSGPPATLCP